MRQVTLLSGLLLAAAIAASVSVPADGAAPGITGPSVSADPIGPAIRASAAPGSRWRPGRAAYGVVTRHNVAVTMRDGTVLRADIASPANAAGRPAAGRFPVLLTQSPYGRSAAGALGSSAIGIDPYFVKRGYIDVAVDVRGTGDSHGSFTLFDPKQVSDGVALVRWASRLPHSDGRVGLHGASYLGINQLLVAGHVGRHSPLKAIFPIVSANEIYRDTAFMGGIPDAEFDVSYLGGLLPVLQLLNPAIALLTDPASLPDTVSVLLQHGRSTLDYNALWLLRTFLGGPQSYDTSYWTARSPSSVLGDVVRNHIPVYLVGGDYDIFQRGEPLNYAALQNAYDGRSTTAPMRPGQPVTGRYQLLDGPYTHLMAAATTSMDQLQLEWFDTWLKGRRTGMARTPTPLHYYDSGTGRYAETTTFPFTGARNTRLYLSGSRSGTAPSINDGTLSTSAPTSSGSDPLVWAPVGPAMCDRSTDQWMMGALTVATSSLPAAVPCLHDDRPAQTGPTALTYTSAPFAHGRRLEGPVRATIYATATSTETEWVVTLEDVAPDGTSRPLTQGALLGSQRAVDGARSWPTMPYHPYTAAAQRAVTPEARTRYDVEVFPTMSTIAAGHRLRVTISSTDFPHLLPTPPQLTRLAGGVYAVDRSPGSASSILLPLTR